MPVKKDGSTFENAAIKWGVTVVGALIIAGAVSLANRDVYNKSQINDKIDVERQWSDVQDKMLMKSIEQQNASIGAQLRMIREDQVEIKKMIRER